MKIHNTKIYHYTKNTKKSKIIITLLNKVSLCHSKAIPK